MTKWRFWSGKTLSVILTIVLIPFIISLVGNYTTWLGTRQTVEITLKLDGWITIGTLRESGLEKLKLTYNGKSVENAMKISWRIINTGSKGILKFETPPWLMYPEKPDLNIVEARITDSPPLLKINKDPLIDSEERSIKVRDIGIFNKGESFRVDVYILDISELISLTDYLKGWELSAKALDLGIKKDVIPEAFQEEPTLLFPKWFLVASLVGGIIVFLAMVAVAGYMAVHGADE